MENAFKEGLAAIEYRELFTPRHRRQLPAPSSLLHYETGYHTIQDTVVGRRWCSSQLICEFLRRRCCATLHPASLVEEVSSATVVCALGTVKTQCAASVNVEAENSENSCANLHPVALQCPPPSI